MLLLGIISDAKVGLTCGKVLSRKGLKASYTVSRVWNDFQAVYVVVRESERGNSQSNVRSPHDEKSVASTNLSFRSVQRNGSSENGGFTCFDAAAKDATE
jgi:hypothetical protein